MLVNKNKTSKKKQKKSSDDYEENLQSMRSWVRKIEQSTNSVSSRLSAVEKRLSVRNNDASNNPGTNVNILDRPFKNVFKDLKIGDNTSKEIVEVSNILDSEFERIQNELVAQQTEVEGINKKIQEINKTLLNIKEEIKKSRDIETKFLTDFRKRLELIEKRAAPIMKLGKLEVPIEISGIVAGLIAIFAALFILMDQTSILVSPAFLGIVGLVFIGSAVFKAVKSRR